MAFGELKITGDEIVKALTYLSPSYNRTLNDDGEQLANLIAERVLNLIKAKLSATLQEDE